jgi:hypothetical protein
MARLRISVAHLGDPRWPRYAVQDSRGRYWTSKKGWSDDYRDALLYHREEEAANEASAMNDCVEPRCFTVTTRIVVHHDMPFSIEQLQELLERSIVSMIPPEQHDLDDAEFEIDVNWEGLEEII